MISIEQRHFLVIKEILQKYLPDTEVRAFGSRISGKAKKYSDLDLVIMGKTKIESKVLIKLKDEFQESDIPFRVDILDWHGISDEFKQTLSKQRMPTIAELEAEICFDSTGRK